VVFWLRCAFESDLPPKVRERATSSHPRAICERCVGNVAWAPKKLSIEIDRVECHFHQSAQGAQEGGVTAHGKPWSDTGLLQALKRVQARVGLKGWGVRSLRHFFITELCRRGAPTMVVKQLAGYSGLATTQRYAHMAGSDLGAAIALFDATTWKLRLASRR
jgi:hypothetical protein